MSEPDSVTEELIIKLVNHELIKHDVHAVFVSDLSDVRAFEPLVRLLNNDTLYKSRNFQFQVHWYIVDKLYAFGTLAVESLIQKLAKTSDEFMSVRNSITQALGKLGDQRAVQPLLQVLERGRIDYMILDVGTALAQLGDMRILEPLCELVLTHPEHAHRANAAIALSGLNDPRSIAALMNALADDPDAAVAIAAAHALGELRAEEAILHLAQASFDLSMIRERIVSRFRFWSVCDAALEALLKIGTEEAKGFVLDWGLRNFSSRYIETRESAVYYLGEIADNRAIPKLVEALDYEEGIALSARFALRAINTPEAKQALSRWELAQQKQI